MLRFSKSSVVELLEEGINLDRNIRSENDDAMHAGKVAALKSVLDVVRTKHHFSRSKFKTMLQYRIDQIQTDHGFDPMDGYAQVQNRKGGHQMWSDYGRYRALLDIASDTDTPIYREGTGFILGSVIRGTRIYVKGK